MPDYHYFQGFLPPWEDPNSTARAYGCDGKMHILATPKPELGDNRAVELMLLEPCDGSCTGRETEIVLVM